MKSAINASCFVFVLAGLLVGGAAMAEAGPGVPSEVIRTLNVQGAVGRPENAEAPGRFSINNASNTVAYNFQAPGIAVVPLADGRSRVWLSWYQQNNKPRGAAIGNGSFPHAAYAYCDEPFGTTNPVWHQVLYVEPVPVHGDETASDPEVALLPDGRLLGSYITSFPSRTRKRSTYAFLIGNPAATNGAFALGRQHWLGCGVLSQPFNADGKTLAVIDEWSVARRFCRLDFPATPERDAIAAVHISDIPWPGHPKLTSFFESSLHTISGNRYRAYRRTQDGVYTTLSEAGGLTWGQEEKWRDHGSVNSRSAFARSPYSGRVIGAVNCPPQGTSQRSDLTLVVSEAEGAPGSFRRALNIEPEDGHKKIAAQYPRLAFDQAGYVYCVYRWSDSRAGAPHNGAAIILARVREDRLAAGTATLADVEKRVVCAATPHASSPKEY